MLPALRQGERLEKILKYRLGDAPEAFAKTDGVLADFAGNFVRKLDVELNRLHRIFVNI